MHPRHATVKVIHPLFVQWQGDKRATASYAQINTHRLPSTRSQGISKDNGGETVHRDEVWPLQQNRTRELADSNFQVVDVRVPGMLRTLEEKVYNEKRKNKHEPCSQHLSLLNLRLNRAVDPVSLFLLWHTHTGLHLFLAFMRHSVSPNTPPVLTDSH